MSKCIHIEAVTVNHNTSVFVELMLRSLRLCMHPSISITVMDNASSDVDDMHKLSAYANSQSISLVQSGFDTKPKHVNSHGEVLRDFVLSHSDCSHYLFVDPDIYFTDRDAIEVMRDKLDATPSAFAVVPRIILDGDYSSCSLKKSSEYSRGISAMNYSMRWQNGAQSPFAECLATMGSRLHPFCALIENSDLFREVVNEVGLSNAWTFEVKNGTHWDTLGLMTAVMKTHGLQYSRSSVKVLHFSGVSHNLLGLEEKRARCMTLLNALRE